MFLAVNGACGMLEAAFRTASELTEKAGVALLVPVSEEHETLFNYPLCVLCKMRLSQELLVKGSSAYVRTRPVLSSAGGGFTLVEDFNKYNPDRPYSGYSDCVVLRPSADGTCLEEFTADSWEPAEIDPLFLRGGLSLLLEGLARYSCRDLRLREDPRFSLLWTAAHKYMYGEDTKQDRMKAPETALKLVSILRETGNMGNDVVFILSHTVANSPFMNPMASSDRAFVRMLKFKFTAIATAAQLAGCKCGLGVAARRFPGTTHGSLLAQQHLKGRQLRENREFFAVALTNIVKYRRPQQ